MYVQTRIKSNNPPKNEQGIRLAVYQPQAGLYGSEEDIIETIKVLICCKDCKKWLSCSNY